MCSIIIHSWWYSAIEYTVIKYIEYAAIEYAAIEYIEYPAIEYTAIEYYTACLFVL